jgi:hypothetical protein
MSTTPAEAILIQGSVNQSAPAPGFLRLSNAGPLTNFLDLPISGILSPNPLKPTPNSVLSCLVDVGAQFRFSDYPAPTPVPLPIGRAVPGPLPIGTPGEPVSPVPPRRIPGLYGSDGTVLVPTQTSGQVTELSGKASDGFTYSLSLDPFSVAASNPVTAAKAWAGVRISLSKTKTVETSSPPPAPPPVLQFGFSYNPLQSQFGVFVECNNVSLGILANMELLYQQEEVTISAVLKRSITYCSDLFGAQTINMDGNSTDPAIYLPIAGVFWPFTELFGFFEPALAYIASQTGDTLPEAQPTPLSVLAQLQYLNNPGLKYPPSWSLAQFIANATAQIGPALGLFAAEFLPPSDSGIQPWIDAARWMGWVLMKGTGMTVLETALTAQYDYWKNYVPSIGEGLKPPPKDPVLPVQQAGVKGQRVLAGEPGGQK